MTQTEWRERFYKATKVYIVSNAEQQPLSFYETPEGAQFEVDWAKERGEYLRVEHVFLHSDELSKARWKDGFDREGK